MINKLSYPQSISDNLADPPYNISKWTKAMRDIYSQAQNGMELGQSFNKITSGWNEIEKLSFKSWLSFYQEGGHNKYKIAQINYFNNGGGFVPSEALKAPIDPNFNEELEKKKLVQNKIKSIIGRLNAAERLATQHDVQIALKNILQMGVEEWVSVLQKLKREIQLAPMRGLASLSLAQDLIYKHSNRLNALGYQKDAKMLLKVAQEATTNIMGAPTMNPGDTVMGGQPVAMNKGDLGTGEATGEMGVDLDATPGLTGLPNNQVNIPQGAGEDEGKDNPTMMKFLELLSNPSGGEEEDKEDVVDIDDDLMVDEGDTNEIQIMAQVSPAQPGTTGLDRTTSPSLPAENLEVSEDEIEKPTVDIDDSLARVLKNVTINDIIKKIDDISAMFKRRTIAREVAIVDLMFNEKNISTYFPSLAEIQRSILESTGYCQSRLDDIAAKLRGTVETSATKELESNITEGDEDTLKIQKELAQQEKVEQERKENRKKQREREEDLKAQPSPAEPSPKELGEQPANIKSAPPVRPEAQPSPAAV